jgi:hypothetical protein
MSLFSRFLGKPNAGAASGGPLVANPAIQHPLSLQVLFPEPVPLEADRLREALRSYDRSMSRARCELDPALSREGKTLGLVGWGKHVIRCAGFDAPMPPEAVEACLAPSHYPQELKARARAHRAHVILYYSGYDASPFEQYVALAATAGALAKLGALVVLNEAGHTSFPAAALSGVDTGGGMVELLREFPLAMLFCGFVKCEVQEIPGVWMRTYGAPLLGLPDLAAHATGHDEGQRYFDMFENIFSYLRESGARLAPGHTLQIDQSQFLRFRSPQADEAFLDSEGQLLVIEPIRPDQINRKPANPAGSRDGG